MVNWESKADRGRRPPNRGRGQRNAQTTKPAPSREKTPTKEAAPAQAPAPRGSPIARKLARHSSPWTTLTIPQMAVKVSLPLAYLPITHYPLPASFPDGKNQHFDRPRPGTTSSHRRRSVPRAGSPAYWVPCLAAPPSGCRTKPGSQPRHARTVPRIRGPRDKFQRTPLPVSHSDAPHATN